MTPYEPANPDFVGYPGEEEELPAWVKAIEEDPEWVARVEAMLEEFNNEDD